MKTCPVCFKDDLHDKARKCPHCQAWLEDSEEVGGRFEELRKELRADLKDDLREHREYLNSLFNRVQVAATVIILLALTVAAYFGLRTDRGIDEITKGITAEIELNSENRKPNASYRRRLKMPRRVLSFLTKHRTS